MMYKNSTVQLQITNCNETLIYRWRKRYFKKSFKTLELSGCLPKSENQVALRQFNLLVTNFFSHQFFLNFSDKKRAEDASVPSSCHSQGT